jgi:DNA-binding HxlR family transcriptional regulator
MAERGDSSEFDSSRAELFEALGHPVRIRILHALQDGPLGFAELKRKVGIESGGHLQFHLGKLDGLIRNGEDGNYYLTDDGRDALRVVGTRGTSAGEEVKPTTRGKVVISRAVLAAILAALVLLAAVAVIEGSGLIRPATQVTVSTCDAKVIFNGTMYCSLDVSNDTELGVPGYAKMSQSFNFMGVLFTTVCPSNIAGCPTNGTTMTFISLGVVSLNLTFSDGSSEALYTIFGDSCPNTPVLTQQHLTPRAGFLLYCADGSAMKLYLLVGAAQQ